MNERLQKAISNTIQAGYQLNHEAFTFLSSLSKKEDPITFMKKIVTRMGELAQKPLFIDRPLLEELTVESTPKHEGKLQPIKSSISSATSTTQFQAPLESRKTTFKPYAKEVDAQIKVLEDPSAEVGTRGSIEEYREYFQDRFRRLQRFLRKRIDVKGAVSISEVLKSPRLHSRVKIIGMITDKKEYKQRAFLRIEDMQNSVLVMVPHNLDNSILERTKSLLLDQVVCLDVNIGRSNLLILKDVVFPEIPQRTPRKSSMPVYATLISDLHIGSKQFMRKELQHFVLWLNGKYGNQYLRELASHVKYIVVAGDLVDGIGIYPGQAKELSVKDVYRQYQLVSKYFERIPEYIELVVIPGNHDASRKALPQPALPKEYAEPIYESRKIYSLGNPSTISLHGVEVLIYHGRSLDDVFASVPRINYNKSEEAMKLLLRCRHLAPIYGQRTPIAPEKRDFMVIERVPDIFHTGHVHVVKHDIYRGTLLVNSGAWQQQTEYMKRLGVIPVPGIAPIVNLQTLQLKKINFVC